MSSFLGSAAAGASLVVLADNVSVSLVTTAAQVIATPGQRCLPLYFVLRSTATALSATTSFKVGVTTALTSIVATTLATSLPSTGQQITACFTSGATTNVAQVPAAGNVYFSLVQIETGSATTGNVDLIGYVY